MRFLIAFKKDGKPLLKIALDDGKEKWMETTEEVFNFAKSNFKGSNRDSGYAGDEVDVQYTHKDGRDYKATRITKKGETAKQQTPPASTKKEGYTCEDCGATLKDDKYKKCYTCNKKNPVKKSSGGYAKSPEVSASIKRQAIGHMTSRTLIALQGQIDPNNVHELAEAIYNTYVRLVG